MEISAKAAHDAALSVNEAIVNELKRSIMKEIADARLNGDYSIQIRFEGVPYERLNKEHICSEIEGYLIGLGYELAGNEDYKTTVMTISWANVKEPKSVEPTWSITDAKPGDVLANDHHILILKELNYDWYTNGIPYSVYAYCGIKPNGNFELGKEHWCFCGTLHMRPATSEERDLLFAKMREAGYEWDEKKKELKKITE